MSHLCSIAECLDLTFCPGSCLLLLLSSTAPGRQQRWLKPWGSCQSVGRLGLCSQPLSPSHCTHLQRQLVCVSSVSLFLFLSHFASQINFKKCLKIYQFLLSIGVIPFCGSNRLTNLSLLDVFLSTCKWILKARREPTVISEQWSWTQRWDTH